MNEVGFNLDKKRDDESTLRVYVGKRLTYPLLNPRFKRRLVTGVRGRNILEITALSKCDETVSNRLAAFPSSNAAVFVPMPSRQGAYYNHGYFAIPLVFQGLGQRRRLDVRLLVPR